MYVFSGMIFAEHQLLSMKYFLFKMACYILEIKNLRQLENTLPIVLEPN